MKRKVKLWNERKKKDKEDKKSEIEYKGQGQIEDRKGKKEE